MTAPVAAVDLDGLEALAKAAAKIAPGLWGSDIEKSEGSYGEGDEDRTGFMVPYMETENGKRLFDAHYCDVAEIHEDYDTDEDGVCTLYAWDENSRVLFNFLAAVQPSEIVKLIAAARERDGLRADKERLDWLEQHTVNVRVPLVHGSRDLFWASPDRSVEGEEGPSDIRSRIDRARQALASRAGGEG